MTLAPEVQRRLFAWISTLTAPVVALISKNKRMHGPAVVQADSLHDEVDRRSCVVCRAPVCPTSDLTDSVRDGRQTSAAVSGDRPQALNLNAWQAKADVKFPGRLSRDFERRAHRRYGDSSLHLNELEYVPVTDREVAEG